MAAHVRILLATRNATPYLQEQLESFATQAHDDWSLHVGDDGSTDDTLAVLERFAAARPGRVASVAPGPCQGSAANFLTLVRTAEQARPGTPMAFSDQDDVWLPHKNARALAALEEIGALDPAGPVAAYVCRTRLTDARLETRGLSRLPQRGPSFGNALVQNILGGQTIVLSAAAAAVLARTVPAALEARVPFHDWWIYQVVTGAGGQVIVDPEPGVLYRQHGGNLLGHNGGVRVRMKRAGQVSRGEHGDWVGRNLAALEAVEDLLAPAERHLASRFRAARRAGPRALLEVLREGQVHRQGQAGTRLLFMQAQTRLL